MEDEDEGQGVSILLLKLVPCKGGMKCGKLVLC